MHTGGLLCPIIRFFPRSTWQRLPQSSGRSLSLFIHIAGVAHAYHLQSLIISHNFIPLLLSPLSRPISSLLYWVKMASAETKRSRANLLFMADQVYQRLVAHTEILGHLAKWVPLCLYLAQSLIPKYTYIHTYIYIYIYMITTRKKILVSIFIVSYAICKIISTASSHPRSLSCTLQNFDHRSRAARKLSGHLAVRSFGVN